MSITRRTFSERLCGTSLAALTVDAGWAWAAPPQVSHAEPWWKTAILYQIYPRSFQDSNGDGMGDFPGMTGRLGYLQDLGANAVWITACFDSPNADNGYDVRDYRRIHPDFGTMDDFDRFMAEANKRKDPRHPGHGIQSLQR